jgi:hypothetical protein
MRRHPAHRTIVFVLRLVSARDHVGDQAITPAGDAGRVVCHERDRQRGPVSDDRLGDMSIAAHVAPEPGSRGAGAGMAESLCICS